MFYLNFKELLRACGSYHKENIRKMDSARILQNRSRLADCAESFHEKCGTLTPSVKKNIEDLRNGSCIVLMTAHQPNFFAYSGVLRKATLIFYLEHKLRQTLGVPVASFFGIADQDFTEDRWVRSCQLPAVQRTNGILSITVELPEKLMLSKVAKPSETLVKKWKTEIEKWLDDAICSVLRLLKPYASSKAFFSLSEPILRGNLESFWRIVEECHRRSANYSDFNAFLISKIVNEVWEHDTVFLRFSESQRIFCDDFNYLLSHFGEYARLLVEATGPSGDHKHESGVSYQEPELAPFWYHCSCGSKAKLFMKLEDRSLIGEGDCVRCRQHYIHRFGDQSDPDISHVISKISARAIPMNLVFFRGVMPSCYIGGLAGTGYLSQAEHVANGLQLPFPPVVVWRPHDKYLGVGQLEAKLELRRICDALGFRDLVGACNLLESRMTKTRELLDSFEFRKKALEEELGKDSSNDGLKQEIKHVSMAKTRAERSSNLSVIAHELKILKNVHVATDLIPSLLDYVINMGLKETDDQWMNFLDRSDDLSSEVQLESAIDHFANRDHRLSRALRRAHVLSA